MKRRYRRIDSNLPQKWATAAVPLLRRGVPLLRRGVGVWHRWTFGIEPELYAPAIHS